ncbi:hypothetical protein IEQ34_016746 [Dendrobium chrysotoxum]|uniref:Uncharacterized protein n=1 Tax=Dendrobium chrysotoxum TaxID=161865 RepID=A0AAV7GG52_DENCH|nr:hypothetical protein IEQ34_016746 [Dendrobium chrysotoxum]
MLNSSVARQLDRELELKYPARARLVELTSNLRGIRPVLSSRGSSRFHASAPVLVAAPALLVLPSAPVLLQFCLLQSSRSTRHCHPLAATSARWPPPQATTSATAGRLATHYDVELANVVVLCSLPYNNPEFCMKRSGIVRVRNQRSEIDLGDRNPASSRDLFGSHLTSPRPFTLSTSLAPISLAANSLPESCDSSPLTSDPYPSFAPANAFSELAEQSRPVRKLALVVDTGNCGLCGGFNNIVLKKAKSRISEIKAKVSTAPEGLHEKSSHHERDRELDQNRDEFLIAIPFPLSLRFRCRSHSNPVMPMSSPEYYVPPFPVPELPKHEVFRAEDLTTSSRPQVVHCSRLRIHQNRPRNESSIRCLVVDVNPLQLQSEHTSVPPYGIDSVLITHHLPKLRYDLVIALSTLQVKDFSHLPSLALLRTRQAHSG